MNLITQLKETLLNDLSQKSATFLSEKPEKLQSALEVLVPMVTAGFMKRAAAATNSHLLHTLITRSNYQGQLSENLSDSLKNADKIAKLIEAGNAAISQLMPDKKSIVTSTVSSHAKIRNSTAMSLLGLVTPFVMDFFGKQIKDKNLDAEGFATLLLEQKDSLVAETPTPILDKIIDVLGIGDLMSLSYQPTMVGTPLAQTASAMETREYVNEGEGFRLPWKWIAAAVAVILIGSAGFYGYKKLSAPSSDIPAIDTTQTPQEEVLVQPDTTATPKADTSATKITVPVTNVTSAGQKLGLTAGSGAYQMADYLADTAAVAGKVFALGNVAFDATNTPTTTASIDELVKVLNTYPNAQVKFSGYVDKSVDSLKAKSVSFKRAHNVKLKLMEKGINLMRLDAEGKGRATTSKIDVKVVKR